MYVISLIIVNIPFVISGIKNTHVGIESALIDFKNLTIVQEINLHTSFNNVVHCKQQSCLRQYINRKIFEKYVENYECFYLIPDIFLFNVLFSLENLMLSSLHSLYRKESIYFFIFKRISDGNIIGTFFSHKNTTSYFESTFYTVTWNISLMKYAYVFCNNTEITSTYNFEFNENVITCYIEKFENINRNVITMITVNYRYFIQLTVSIALILQCLNVLL